jgi:ParB-like chromosome segregation protein Spo0J
MMSTPSMSATSYTQQTHVMAKLFPPLTGKRFDELVADVKSKGLLNPIVLHAGVVLDGMNRLRACRIAGIPARFVEFSSLNLKCSPEEYIWSSNIERRQLTPDQRTVLAFDWAKALREQAKAKQQLGGKDKTPQAEAIRTRAAIAQRAQVSEHKVAQVERVKKNAPHLVAKVASGTMKLKDAAKVADKKRARGKSHKPTVVKTRITHPLTVAKAINRTIEMLESDVKIVLLRVENHPAYFAALASRLTAFAAKIKKAAGVIKSAAA